MISKLVSPLYAGQFGNPAAFGFRVLMKLAKYACRTSESL